MTADDFERAILADPADDTPRLVYADWLDETGDPANAARAAYIRLQCDAARLSDLDHRRHRLERQASLLFHTHWRNWWRPVCRRLGLPEPSEPDARRFARLRRMFGDTRTTGSPFRVDNPNSTDTIRPQHDSGSRLVAARFARGFVDDLDLSGWRYAGPSVADWLTAVPAVGLGLALRMVTNFASDDTPALRNVRKLSLDITDAPDVSVCLRSPHLVALEQLQLDSHGEGVTAEELATVAATPVAPRLRQLVLDSAAVPAVGVVADLFADLRSLTLVFEEEFTGNRPPEVRAGVASLNAGLRPRLERLSLFTHGDLPPAGFAELSRRPWEQLNTLELLDPLVPEDVRQLSADAFPRLAELFVVLEPAGADETLEALVTWSADKRLTRLCFGGGTPKADPRRIVTLAESLDLDVLQTFHLEPHADPTLEPRLRSILGERLWMG